MTPASQATLPPPTTTVEQDEGLGRRVGQTLATHPRAVALASYAGLALVLFAGAWRSPTVVNIGGVDDPPLLMWFLRWTPHALSHARSPFLTDHVNYPFGVNLMWNTVVALPGLLLWPVTAAFGPVASYNVFVSANVVLSAWCASLAIRHVVAQPLAAWVGGLVYGFGPYMLAQSTEHPNLTAAFVPPLLAVVLADILITQYRSRRRAGLVLGLLAAAQFFITEELLASEALAAAVGLAVLVVLHRREVRSRAPHALVALGWALAVCAVLAAWPLAVQFLGPQRVHGVIQPPHAFVTDIANFVVPTRGQLLAPARVVASQSWTGNPLEWDAYLGLPLLAVVGFVAVRFWARPVVRAAATFGLCMAVLSLGPSLHVNGRDAKVPLPWRAVEKVPVVANMLPNRLALYVDLAAALLLSIFVAHVLDRRTRRGRAAGLAVLAVVVVTLLPTLPYPSSTVAVPAFFTGAGVERIPEGSVALVAPYQQLLPSAPMLWQARAGMRYRMPQGYFIAPDEHGKPGYGAPPSTMSQAMYAVQRGEHFLVDAELRSAVLADMAARRVRTVLVGPMAERTEMVRFFSDLLGRPPELVGGVYVWWDASPPSSPVVP